MRKQGTVLVYTRGLPLWVYKYLESGLRWTGIQGDVYGHGDRTPRTWLSSGAHGYISPVPSTFTEVAASSGRDVTACFMLIDLLKDPVLRHDQVTSAAAFSL